MAQKRITRETLSRCVEFGHGWIKQASGSRYNSGQWYAHLRVRNLQPGMELTNLVYPRDNALYYVVGGWGKFCTAADAERDLQIGNLVEVPRGTLHTIVPGPFQKVDCLVVFQTVENSTGYGD